MKQLEYFKYGVLYFLSFIFRPFFSINSNLLLFSARGGRGYEGNTKYLYLYSSQYTDYECVWITKDLEILKMLNQSNYRCVYYFSMEALKLSLQAHAVFITHSLSDVMPVFYKKKTKIINLWHGIPLKNIEFLDQNMSLKGKINNTIKSKRTNIFISNSKYYTSIYKKCFRLKDCQIKVIGYPRMEFLRNSQKFKKTQNPFHMPSDSEHKIYLYAPTFRDYESRDIISENLLKKLNEIMITKNALFYIKLHPFDKRDINIAEYSNIQIIESNIDVQECLVYVDYLITDYSSIFLDFMVLDKPILLFCYDLEEYKEKRGFLIDFETIFEDIIVQTEDSFLDILKLDGIAFTKKDFIIDSQETSYCSEILNEVNR
ncbi:CDP-glycerol glycerophosphotransferase family protein [Priestia megaterium]